MKIVVASARPVTVPPTRGDTSRILHFARELALDHEVSLVCPGATDLAGPLAAMGVEAAAPDLVIPRPRLLPLQVLPATRWRVPRSLEQSADVIHLSTVRSVPLVAPATLARCHVDFVDALSENMRLRAESDTLRSPLWRLESAALHRLERAVSEEAASTSAISERDADLLGPGTQLVPNGVTVPDDDGLRATLPTIAFAGNLGYYPNVEAASILARRILPAVRRRSPDVCLEIVGARPSRAVRRLAGDGVRVTSDVPSLTPHLHAAWVIAAPVQRGTGVQTKVLEGMAHGRPVVTTSAVAARITHASPDRDLVVADGDRSIAEAILRLIEDAPTGAAIGIQGRDLVRRHYSWSASTERLVAAYRPSGAIQP